MGRLMRYRSSAWSTIPHAFSEDGENYTPLITQTVVDEFQRILRSLSSPFG